MKLQKLIEMCTPLTNFFSPYGSYPWYFLDDANNPMRRKKEVAKVVPQRPSLEEKGPVRQITSTLRREEGAA